MKRDSIRLRSAIDNYSIISLLFNYLVPRGGLFRYRVKPPKNITELLALITNYINDIKGDLQCIEFYKHVVLFKTLISIGLVYLLRQEKVLIK